LNFTIFFEICLGSFGFLKQKLEKESEKAASTRSSRSPFSSPEPLTARPHLSASSPPKRRHRPFHLRWKLPLQIDLF
jgi:hypothetical protein